MGTRILACPGGRAHPGLNGEGGASALANDVLAGTGSALVLRSAALETLRASHGELGASGCGTSDRVRRGTGRVRRLGLLAQARAVAIFRAALLARRHGVAPGAGGLEGVELGRVNIPGMLVRTEARGPCRAPEGCVLRVVRGPGVGCELSRLRQPLSHAKRGGRGPLVRVLRVLHRIGTGPGSVVAAALPDEIPARERVGGFLFPDRRSVIGRPGTVRSNGALRGLGAEGPLRCLDAQHFDRFDATKSADEGAGTTDPRKAVKPRTFAGALLSNAPLWGTEEGPKARGLRLRLAWLQKTSYCRPPGGRSVESGTTKRKKRRNPLTFDQRCR